MLENRTEDVKTAGGPIVELDGIEPVILHEPSLKDLQTWILIAMGGFFTFITVFGCLLVFVQLGFIPVNGAGQIILTSEAIRRTRRLLTTDEVARLQPGGDLYDRVAVAGEEEETQPTRESASRDPADSGEDVTTVNVRINAVAVQSFAVDQEEDHSCAVCLDELVFAVGEDEVDNETLCLPCKHHFHVECIIPWLTERHATCPLCKFDVLQFIMDMDEKSSTKKKSRASTYFSRCKEQARRLMRVGWSPVDRSDSESQQSQQPESSTTSSENEDHMTNSMDTAPI